MRRLIIALVLLAGCTSETPLEPAVGKVLVRKHIPSSTTYMPVTHCVPAGKTTSCFTTMMPINHPDEWAFAVAWDAQRFENDDTKEVRVEPAHTESGFHVTEEVYDTCKVGEWAIVDGETIDCQEGHP